MGGLPDKIVSRQGVTVTHWKVTEYVDDGYDEVDLDASTVVETDIKAVLSKPRKNRQVLVGGRTIIYDLVASVQSSVDISPSRAGVPDRIQIPTESEWFEVQGVVDDTHCFVRRARKKTVYLKMLQGREE